MKTSLLIIACIVGIVTSVKAQDNLYTINNYGGTTGITGYSNVNPDSGITAAGTVFGGANTQESAAIAMNASGWIYYIPAGTVDPVIAAGLGGGQFEVHSIKKDGTLPAATPVLTADINGAGTAQVEFKRLGMRADGWAYMVNAEQGTGVIYIARFQTHADGKATNFEFLGTAKFSDAKNYNNGDLAFDGSGNMYILANGGSITHVYKLDAATVNGLTAASSNTNLQYKWTVKNAADNSNFTIPITGVAFSSTGSLYVTAQDGGTQGGIYFIDQNSVDSSTETLLVSQQIVSGTRIGDLATEYTPPTTLPVLFGEINAAINNNELALSWSTLSETNNDHFDIEISKNGTDFKKLGTVTSKALNGNSGEVLNYQFSSPLSNAASLLGISFLSLAFIVLLFNRKNKVLLVLMIVVAAGFGVGSCSRSTDQIDMANNSKLFVRIVQVNKDGTSKSSKVITVYKAD